MQTTVDEIIEKQDKQTMRKTASLQFRMTDGRPFKRHIDNVPEWALTILK